MREKLKLCMEKFEACNCSVFLKLALLLHRCFAQQPKPVHHKSLGPLQVPVPCSRFCTSATYHVDIPDRGVDDETSLRVSVYYSIDVQDLLSALRTGIGCVGKPWI